REDLDAPETGTIVFGREGIGVDTDLANRSLRREIAPREAIDVDLSAIGPAARAGHCLQLLGQFVGSSERVASSFSRRMSAPPFEPGSAFTLLASSSTLST